jgi:hypothetical protein
MKRPVSATTHAAIEMTMDRLLNADDGATLTIARLAAETGLSRATLYRAPALLERFRAATEQCERISANTRPNIDRIGELEAEIAILRSRENDEMRDLRAANRNMGQHIQALSLLVREQECRIAVLQLERSGSVRVVPLVAATPG